MNIKSTGESGPKLDDLEKLLIARATTNASGERRYKALRADLLSEKEIGRHLPVFVRNCPSLEDFWNSITKLRTYSERRVHIQRAFERTRREINVDPKSHRRVFIGHGHSSVWFALKDFLFERLGLAWDEFNREAVAGYSTKERLETLLQSAMFAFVVMTAEEERPDGVLHARDNVIHEIGLFQGRLGFSRAIILLEEDCAEFSNIVGLTHIHFPKGNISAVFEKIRQVLEREEIVSGRRRQSGNIS